MRCELVAKNGEVIPMLLSAALVAEGSAETATVGVFRDLRAELRVEEELQKTRARLEAAEKVALVSELAGAAAHELNQPLTSVLGYSELLFRRTHEQDRGRDELRAIVREAERMAAIVKKIGKITRYETTSYVGSTRIVDLDRSSDPPPLVIRDKT
jgi:signal transduction histidine kinase